MPSEPNKRPRRVHLTSEEVSSFIAYRKRRERLALQNLKKTHSFKLLNIFNVACIFIYCELLFCYFGPSNHQRHYSVNTIAEYGNGLHKGNQADIKGVQVFGVNGKEYKFIVNDFIEVPAKKICFLTGKDFLLQKDLKGWFDYPGKSYRLFSASPILFLCLFISLVSFIVFFYNLNENAYSLCGITVLNALTILGISAI